MVASHQSPSASPWSTDTGSTNHITFDTNYLTLQYDYHGSYRVYVGNGAGLRISHIDSSSFSTPTAYLRLSNMLHIHNIIANLISVHCFAYDNNYIFEFDAFGFCVKDRATGKMLFRRRSENILYPFPMSSYYSNKASPTFISGKKSLLMSGIHNLDI